MASPFPETFAIADPVVRQGAYVAVGVQEAGKAVVRWHVWHADGTYAGYCTHPALIQLTIARHQGLTGT